MLHTGAVNDLDQPVWYAAYGSNLSSARFRTYLEGGVAPNATDDRPQRGARDQTPPSGNGPCEIDRALIFAGAAKRWGGGGVAFLDADATPDFPILGRAWRITLGQFEDVFRQENGLDDVIDIDLAGLHETGSLELRPDRYGRVELLSAIDDVPVLTLASANPPPLNAAHDSYLKVMGEGLVETWQLDPYDAARYLAALPGNEGSVEFEHLAEVLGVPAA